MRANRTRPDLAIEVVWTRGTIRKLEIYRRLRIREVWFWRKRGVTVHVLTRRGYEEREVSHFVPGIDFTILDEMLALAALSDVLEALRERLPPR